MEYAPRFGFASSKTGLLDNTRVRVVLVAVVAILVFLFVGHLCLLSLLRFNVCDYLYYLFATVFQCLVGVFCGDNAFLLFCISQVSGVGIISV